MSESRSAVSGTRRAIRELVDGTIRVQIDIDPAFRSDFHRLFPEIDMMVALAPLSPHAVHQDRVDGGWKKLGPITQSAVMIGREPAFQRYVAEMLELDESHHEAADEEQVADYIREYCKVSSRKELDTNDGARERFGSLMAHYREWIDSQSGS